MDPKENQNKAPYNSAKNHRNNEANMHSNMFPKPRIDVSNLGSVPWDHSEDAKWTTRNATRKRAWTETEVPRIRKIVRLRMDGVAR